MIPNQAYVKKTADDASILKGLDILFFSRYSGYIIDERFPMPGKNRREEPKGSALCQGFDLLLPLLSLVNSYSDPQELSEALIGILNEWLGCTSVQFKLFRNNGVVPRAGSCARGLTDIPVRSRQNDGSPKAVNTCKNFSFLDCLGARLLRDDCHEILGTTLTPNGSFWTNDLDELLDKNKSLGGNRRQQACCGGGPKSVVVTPLKYQDSVFGLLQATDRQSERFTERSVEIVEEVARFLAGIWRRSRLEQRCRVLFEGAGLGLMEQDFSRVKEFLDEQGICGQGDLLRYLDGNPRCIPTCADMVLITDANQAAVDVYNAASKNDLSCGFSSVFTNESYDAFKKLLVALLEGETRLHANTINKSLNGELKQVSLTWYLSSADRENWRRIICSVEDITAQKQAVEKLNEQLLFFQTLIDTVPTPIFYKDTEHRYLGCNKAFEIYSKKKRQDVVGKTVFDLLADAHKARIHHLADGELLLHPGKRLYESSIEHGNGKKSTNINRKATFVRPDGTSAGIVGVILDITEQKIAEDRLRKSQEELRNLSRRLQYVREEERKAISREIHDQLGQTLTVMQMELALLMKKVPATQKGLIEGTKQLKKRVREAIEIVRSISARTRPEMLDDLGLAAAIEWQVGEFQKLTGLTCVVSIDQTEKEIEANLSTALFRILQEALTNVWRHAHATHVHVLLRLEEVALVLEVHDNGKGITEKQANDSTSTGLIGMRERVYSWAGEVTIEGVPNGGTTVRVAIPLKTGSVEL